MMSAFTSTSAPWILRSILSPSYSTTPAGMASTLSRHRNGSRESRNKDPGTSTFRWPCWKRLAKLPSTIIPTVDLEQRSKSIADQHHAQHNIQKKNLTVKTLTLTQICKEYAPRDIHFLKIDVEGAEASALRSMDFQKYRPWILCVESHFPLRTDLQVHGEWDHYVLESGYQFAFTDRINRYYVAQEHKERAASFAFPSDFYMHRDDFYYVRELEERIRSLEANIKLIKGIIEKEP